MMNTKRYILMNPSFETWQSYVDKIPDIFATEGDVIYEGRNLIKVLAHNGQLINVKRYRVPRFLNRVVYTFFRNPKAKRAFEYAEQIVDKGFNTPTPIAHIVEKKGGLIAYSYLITCQSPLKRNFYEFGTGEVQEKENILVAFARFTANLHEAGIYHKDYSPGNILFDVENNQYVFSIVDINRMCFGKVNIKKGCKNFERLWGKTELFKIIAKEYANVRGYNEKDCIELVIQYRNKFWKKYALHHEVGFSLD